VQVLKSGKTLSVIYNQVVINVNVRILTRFFSFLFVFFFLSFLRYDFHSLGLCSKAVCLKALENTNWDMEKAASSLLDP
jgi:hypothetical protein